MVNAQTSGDAQEPREATKANAPASVGRDDAAPAAAADGGSTTPADGGVSSVEATVMLTVTTATCLVLKIILVQNAPDSASEKIAISPPTPNFNITVHSSPATNERSSQVIANIECSVSPHYNTVESTYKFEEPLNTSDDMYLQSYTSTLNKSMQSQSLSDPVSYTDDKETTSLENTSFDALELNIQEVLALDVEHSAQKSKISLAHSSRADDRNKNKSIFKSLPNLSASSENLLV
ncbi:hypothetical protein FQR65_LT02486 [Abscondita terminalis]|nr:hypothetical protein FQR65_LT02486 [Abscondita terminalis]